MSVLDPSSERFINYTIKGKKIRSYDNQIWLLAEDSLHNYWCGNLFSLFLFNTKTKTFSHYIPNEKDPDGLAANGYGNLFTDRSGTLWVETVPQGLYWVNKRRSKFMIYKNEPAKPHYFPGGNSTSFAQDKDGTFWVWSHHGLYHWYPSTDSFTLIKQMKDQLGEGNIWHLSSTLVDRKGIVWCGSFYKGLFSYNPKTGRIKNYKNNPKDSTSISNDGVLALLEDDEGIFWIGTGEGGLCSFNQETGRFKQYPHTSNNDNSPTNNKILNDWTIYCMMEDRQGDLWLGTNNGGVSRFNRETETFTSYKNQSPGLTISKIFEDSKGNIWVGTHASGLFLFDRNTDTFKKFSKKDGLLYAGVVGINEDNENNLWITSPVGISILNIQTKKISGLGLVNGLPVESDYNNNFFKTKNGRFLMPFNNGFVSFDPEQLKPDTMLPVIHVESVQFTRPQKEKDKQTDSVIQAYGKNKIELCYNENRITFNYIGLQYQNSQLNQYAYKLDGYDNDWIQAGTQRKVTYPNLSPGTYIFHVKAANSDGVWNEQGQALIVIISPPWWFTWWAYTLYFLLAAAIIYLLYRNRIKQLERKQATQIKAMVATQEEERKRISRDLHDDVGTKLSALKLFLSSLDEKVMNANNNEIKSLAESSSQFITEVMQDVRKLLLNLSPAVLEEFGYTTAVEGLVNKINETKRIHFSLVVFGMKQRFQKEYELALYRITQELINNVLKHAEAKNVSLQIGKRDDKIILMIEDDGKGFDITAHTNGYGLHNLEARTKLMRGVMTIDSQPGKGTSVLIEIPDNFN